MEENFSTIKERILQIAEKEHISKEIFFKNLGVTYGNFKGKSLKSSLSSDVLVEIFTQFPKINIKWLLFGEGGMYLKEQKETEIGVLHEPDPGYAKKCQECEQKKVLIEALQKTVASQEEVLTFYRKREEKTIAKRAG